MLEGFVHPLLAWGAALASVPLIIHLLNRQRHQPMRWAAMQYMLAAYRRTRRRARLESLLLLLLRMAAVALLALALARPFTGADSPLSSLTESRRDLVLVIDDSASTGYRENVQSVHETILERARTLLDDLDASRGDRVRLVLAGAGPQVLSARSPEDARSMLATLGEPSDEALELSVLLGEILRMAEEEAAGTSQSRLEVRLLTDLQRRTFDQAFAPPGGASPDPGAASTEASSSLVDLLDQLQALGVRVGVEDLGSPAPTPPNLGIVDVAPAGDLFGPGEASEIAVGVHNFGPVAQNGVRVALVVDGERLPSRRLDVAPRSRGQVIFRVPFSSSGLHTLVAELEGDRLSVDDRRATVLRVPDPIRVLLVNGDPHPEIDRDEVGYLRAVLEPPAEDAPGMGSVHSPFLVSTVDALAFGNAERDLSDEDVVVLANVNSISARVVGTLEEWVAAGGVLLFTMGDHTADSGAIESLNARFWKATGGGLLPGKLFRAVEVPSRYDAYYRCAWFDATHPGLSFFADEAWRPFLTEVPIYAFVATQDLAQTTSVLAHLDDEARSPLLLERPFGRGRVLVWTTSIDRDWSRVADSPSTLIPLVHELLRYAASGDEPDHGVRVGEGLSLELDRFPRSTFIVPPDQTRRELDAEPLEVARDLWSLPMANLDRAGLWRLEHEEGSLPFAVQLDPSEGDLARISGEELTRQHRAWYVVDPSSSEGDDAMAGNDRGELWRPLAMLALAALVAETLWSAWIGRGRRRA